MAEKKWYSLHVQSGYEYEVRANIFKVLKEEGLLDKVEEIFIPAVEKVVFKVKGKVKGEIPLKGKEPRIYELEGEDGKKAVFRIEDGKVWGFFEHHTKFLNAKKMKYFLEKLCRAELSFEEVFEDGGHGAFSMKRVSPQKVYLVGPNREFFKELGEYAYPIGDSMLAGCSGLYEVYKRNFS